VFFHKSKSAKRNFTRVFFVTDVHGSTDCFMKFLNAGREYECDCLVLGGDITGKMVIPIVEQANGTYEATFIGNHYTLEDAHAVARLEEAICRSGSYPYHTSVDEIQQLGAGEPGGREGRINAIAVELMAERLRGWMRLVDERFADSSTKVFVGAGNDDPFELDTVLADSDVAILYDGHVVSLDEHHEMIGLGYANPTPWNCPRDVSEEELRRRLDDLAGRVRDLPNSIFCAHIPPLGSGLDKCYKLDSSCYPPAVIHDRGGQPIEFGAGSVAIREGIEAYQPLVGLHGHIHESRATGKIGRTQVFNPGSEYAEGVLRGLILNLMEDRVLSYQYTSG